MGDGGRLTRQPGLKPIIQPLADPQRYVSCSCPFETLSNESYAVISSRRSTDFVHALAILFLTSSSFPSTIYGYGEPLKFVKDVDVYIKSYCRNRVVAVTISNINMK